MVTIPFTGFTCPLILQSRVPFFSCCHFHLDIGFVGSNSRPC
jgi:hypothetical protein